MMQNIHAPDVAKSYTGQAHRGFAQISSCFSQVFGKFVKKAFFFLILIFTAQASIASEISTIVGQQVATTTLTETAIVTVEEVSKALAPALEVVSWIGVGVQVCYVVVDMKSYFYPNKEEQSSISHASEQLELATARNKFKHCLITNKLSSEIDPSGCPILCKEAAQMLVMCRGKNEVINIMKNFNEMKKGKS